MSEPHSGTRKGETHRTDAFLPLAVAHLGVEEALPFDLFMSDGVAFTRVRQAHEPMTSEVLGSLAAEGLKEFHVATSDKPALARHFERVLELRLNDARLSIDERAALLMDAGRAVMDELFTHPESPNTLATARALVAHTAGFVCSGRPAFRSLIRLGATDAFTYTHSLQVAVYSIALGRQLGLSPNFLQKLGEGALLHDLGKSLVPPEILTKTGPLDAHEWQVMKQHPALGVDLLSTQGPLDELTRWAIIGHHERIDGKGYPYGLQKDEVALPGRIVALADIYDALTTHRPYHPAARSFEALNIIKEQLPGGVDGDLFRELVILLANNSLAW